MTKKSSGIRFLPLWILVAFIVGGVLGWQILGSKGEDFFAIPNEDIDTLCNAGSQEQAAGDQLQLAPSKYKITTGQAAISCKNAGYGAFKSLGKTTDGRTVISCEGGIIFA